MCDASFSGLPNQCFIFVQVLLGVISPNFRMVYMSKSEEKFFINIILEEYSLEDLEEIEDLGAEYESHQQTEIEYEIKTMINSDNLSWPDNTNIVIYKRRE
jgi:hypothetical protein